MEKFSNFEKVYFLISVFVIFLVFSVSIAVPSFIQFLIKFTQTHHRPADKWRLNHWWCNVMSVYWLEWIAMVMVFDSGICQESSVLAKTYVWQDVAFLIAFIASSSEINVVMSRRRAAGFLIFRQLNDQIEYLLLKASYGSRHWTPPKGLFDFNWINSSM